MRRGVGHAMTARPERVPAEEVRQRMLEAGRKLADEAGAALTIEHLRLEEVIQRAVLDYSIQQFGLVVSDAEVIRAYKGQAQAEGGFRFLKDPLFFVSALFVKKPTRIQGLLMVMTLALLVYSVAQRRLRQE